VKHQTDGSERWNMALSGDPVSRIFHKETTRANETPQRKHSTSITAHIPCVILVDFCMLLQSQDKKEKLCDDLVGRLANELFVVPS
jgi:coproporphyrinogen III oxidase-like Fe-S oxidoreductase